MSDTLLKRILLELLTTGLLHIFGFIKFIIITNNLYTSVTKRHLHR
jgi:hypothetical protein